MKSNRLSITIDKPIEEVFEFTTNPQNTSSWISSIRQELADEFPPKVGTGYKNTSDYKNWDFYKVTKYELDKLFELSDSDGNYHVEYSYKMVGENQTRLVYYEWMRKGELMNPFSLSVLNQLKKVLENTVEKGF